MNRLFIILLLLVIPTISFSQSSKLDSLKNELDSTIGDTSKVNVLLKIYNIYESGKINEGKKYLDQALEISKNIEDKKFIANVKLSLGKYYNITGEYEESINHLIDAQDIFQELKLELSQSSVYNNIGATYESMGRYDEAMEYFLKSISISESLKDSIGIARTLLNLGLLYSRQEKYEKSLEIYNESLEISKRLKDKEDVALLYNNIAIVNYYLEDYDNVRNNFEKAYKVYVETGNLRRQLMALSNLAEVDKMIGQKEKALKSFFEILKLEKELGQKGEMVRTYYAIAEIYLSRNDLIEAKKYCDIGLDLANEIGAKAESLDYYILLININKKEQNFKTALEYSELLFLVNDSVFNEEKAKQLQELETQYETKKKEQQIKNLKNERIIKNLKIKRQRFYILSFIVGFVIVLLFVLVLYKQNKRIRFANKLLAHQKKQITDSIEYASRIQTAILPPGDYINKIIPDHFIFYKPRDIVSGDFYWITHKEGKIIVAAVDCTGHGVPGAFMSMLGFAFLNEIVNRENSLKANEILNQLRDNVKKSLHQTGKEGEAKDGMDIALCIIDPDNLKLQYAGAYNPLFLIRNKEFVTIKADRMPIGIYAMEKDSFTNHETDIQKGDSIYIFTDGYVDQFGGPNKQKYKRTPFKNLLEQNQDKSMVEQKRILETTFEEWMGSHDQIDDVLVIGIKI